jgi:sucrose phosphorylase
MSAYDKVLHDHLAFLYGEERAPSLTIRLLALLDRFRQDHHESHEKTGEDRISERDAILITYGDMVQEPGKAPLRALAEFLEQYVTDAISTIHILPFFPFSSDDGFSVIDYCQVNPDIGTWEDITRIGRSFRLMFDAVINHISAQSDWFQCFLRDDPRYMDYFTVIEPGTDLSSVFRPRSSPLLTPVRTPSGEKLVWTTFSADQVDLNFRDPVLLFEIIETLLYYIDQGAEFLRLDAVTFLWKEIGTSSANLPQTHCIIQLFRTVLNIVAPQVTIITETNIPHKENISYFGDGFNEAHMVYNFALPLLTIHTFCDENAEILSDWAASLDYPSTQTTYFNFLAGHDGIGIQPVRDILSRKDIDQIIERATKIGGYVSEKSNSDGSLSPYELNINFLDMLKGVSNPNEDTNLVVNRFLTSHAIMLALRGVPGIYFHSFFGSQGWHEGVEQTGRYRTINREKLIRHKFEAKLAEPQSLHHCVYHGFMELLKKRNTNPAFHPNSDQRVIRCHKSIFALLRSSLDGNTQMLCLHNVSNRDLDVSINLRGLSLPAINHLFDLLSERTFMVDGNSLDLSLEPYQSLWLQFER